MGLSTSENVEPECPRSLEQLGGRRGRPGRIRGHGSAPQRFLLLRGRPRHSTPIGMGNFKGNFNQSLILINGKEIYVKLASNSVKDQRSKDKTIGPKKS